MADIETLGIVDEIQSIVSDKLQVVSYKWLSQNFLVSSNAAKRLLQEFVEKHGNGIEVVYSLSGWLKNNPSAYHVLLVSGPKLAEARQKFNENCSIQVYSVQACIPKDPAVLWNAEFVQAEELFKDPNNCFWDNRFCGVSNSFVKRNGEETYASTGAPQAKSTGGLGTSKSKLTSQSVTIKQPQQKEVQQADPSTNRQSPSVVNDVKNEIPEAGGSKLAIDKEVLQPLAKKKKVQTDKTSAGNGGALANMWGRATTKSKAEHISTETNNAIPNSTEAQICAHEEVEDGNSNEDGQDDNILRSNNGKGNRKRRVIYDDSDDEEEDAVNLASPDPPKTGTSMGLKQSLNTNEIEKTLHFEENEKTDKKLKGESLPTVESKNHTSSSDISGHGPSNDANAGVKKTGAAPILPQKRKVLKTRIDERGREVTEVVWEGEEETKSDITLTKKAENKIANEVVDRPLAAKKSHAIGNNAPSNQAVKAGNKKGGNKDPKQGNILSFFKRV